MRWSRFIGTWALAAGLLAGLARMPVASAQDGARAGAAAPAPAVPAGTPAVDAPAVDAEPADAAPATPPSGAPAPDVGEAPAPPPTAAEAASPVGDAEDAGALPDSPDFSETKREASTAIRYALERVEIHGNRTRTAVIRRYVSLKSGELFDVTDPSIDHIRYRLLGTGWFDDVKLSLKRGKHKGWVVLVVEVKERNTVVIERFVAGVARAVSGSSTKQDSLRPYAGLGLADTNLFGLGIGVAGAAVVSQNQYGLDFRYTDPMLFGSGYSLTGRVFHNYAREFFGQNPLVAITCPPQKIVPGKTPDPCDPDVAGNRAVVIYHRTGFGLGTGHDISAQLRYTLDWLGEVVAVVSKPDAASTQRGREIVPIDFRIHDATSVVSSLRVGFIYDDRDHPVLTTRGDLGTFYGRFASGLLGSSYDFARFEGSFQHWLGLPWGHVLRLGALAGTVFGDAPFFYDFYAADLSDLLPTRVLELNLDRRRTPNLLHTSIAEMDMEDLAGRIDFQYQLPLQRGGGFVRGVDAYLGAGLFLLTRRQDLRIAISGYHGLSRIPVDLTFDLGVRADTEIGLVKLGFSTLIGFLPDLSQGNP